MERMITFCLIFFCSSMLLSTAAPTKQESSKAEPTVLRYKELLKTVTILKERVKFKDVEPLSISEETVHKCLASPFNCFQKASLHLEPASKQADGFKVYIRRLNRTINSNTASDMHCSPCYSYAKEAPTNFLDSFMSQLQKQIKASQLEQNRHEDYRTSSI